MMSLITEQLQKKFAAVKLEPELNRVYFNNRTRICARS